MLNYKTVRKNAFKMQEKIFAGAYDCVVHSLDNGFNAKPVENIQWLKKDYQTTSFAKMDYNFENELYTIHYHSNLWYRFKSKFKQNKHKPKTEENTMAIKEKQELEKKNESFCKLDFSYTKEEFIYTLQSTLEPEEFEKIKPHISDFVDYFMRKIDCSCIHDDILGSMDVLAEHFLENLN